MPYFDKSRDIKKIELLGEDGLPNGYWITLRHLTVTESKEIGKQIADAPEGPERDKAQGAAGEQGVLTAIWDWNLTESDGNGGEVKVPIERAKEVIGNMPQGDYMRLLQEYGKFEGIKTDARFPDGAAGRDNAGLGGAAGIAAVPGASSALATVGA
jgi:hypothetical protein